MVDTYDQRCLNIHLDKLESFFGTKVTFDFLCEYLNIRNLDEIDAAFSPKEDPYIQSIYIIIEENLWEIKSNKSANDHKINEFELTCRSLCDIKTLSFKIDDLDVFDSKTHESKFILEIIFYDNYKIELNQSSKNLDSVKDFSLKHFYKKILALR
ncbi:hypothetical protein [Fuchsiella alkaliacetigena]|uniref:hypothetical protein n=1 Tax=Fuchsiella alkaliacetigena TaxID=957042 RepID=UPI00200A2D3E|nr:hypothetical protein [Fuchsiella alkaliacetigena]MCK8824683.1 hypothetical protein [Fuchsiella alkaliacetigena]